LGEKLPYGQLFPQPFQRFPPDNHYLTIRIVQKSLERLRWVR